MDMALIAGRVLLAGVFLLAAATKLADAAGSRQAMLDFGARPSWAPWLARGLPWIEMAVSAVLLIATTAWWGAVAALALLTTFTAAILVALARGHRPPCRCFGQLQARPVGWRTLARNGALLAIALFIVVAGRKDPGPSAVAWLAGRSVLAAAAWIGGALGLALLAATVWLLLEILRQQGRILVRLDAIEAAKGATPLVESAPDPRAGAVLPPAMGLPIGAGAPDFELPSLAGPRLDLSSFLANGHPALLLFTDPHCGPCNALLPEIEQWHATLSGRLTFVMLSRGSVEDNRAKAEGRALPTTLLQDDFEVAQAFQIHGTPTAVLVSADGTVASPAASGADGIRALVLGGPPPVVAQGARQAGHPSPLPRGTTVPDVELRDLEGETVRLADALSGPSAVLFWNPGCGFCQQMLGDLQSWEERTEALPARLLVISQGTREENAAMGLRSTVLLDSGFAAGHAFGTSGTPTALLVDGAGRVASELAVGRQAVLELLAATGS